MKVIHVFTSFPNKYQPYNLRLVKSLTEEGLDIMVVTDISTEKGFSKEKIILTHPKNLLNKIKNFIRAVKLALLKKDNFTNTKFKERVSFFRKYFYVHKYRNGVFHYHKIQSISEKLLNYLKRNNIKFIVSLRGYDVTIQVLESKKHSIHFKEIIQATWKVHSVCYSLKRDLMTLESSINEDKIKVIYRTPNIKDIIQIPIAEQLTNTIHIFTISRIHWKKCISESLISIKQLLKEGFDVKYHIIGGFQGYERIRLLYLIKKLELEESVILHGFLKENEYQEILHDMHIFWLPTINEGIPNTLYYIISCGFPIVACRTDGIPEIIHHRENGLLFEPYDFQDLAGKTKLLINDNLLRKTIQLNAKATVLQTLDQEVKLYTSLYNDSKT